MVIKTSFRIFSFGFSSFRKPTRFESSGEKFTIQNLQTIVVELECSYDTSNISKQKKITCIIKIVKRAKKIFLEIYSPALLNLIDKFIGKVDTL